MFFDFQTERISKSMKDTTANHSLKLKNRWLMLSTNVAEMSIVQWLVLRIAVTVLLNIIFVNNQLNSYQI